MDIFKFNDRDTFLNGELIKPPKSIVWTEKYREPSGFQLVDKVSSDLKNILPIGTVIGQRASMELMIVENHEIVEDDGDPDISVTGRSLQAILDERIVGQNQDWVNPPANLNEAPYSLPSGYSWVQAVKLINDHINVSNVLNSGDGIPLIVADHGVIGASIEEDRVLRRGSVLSHLLALLEVDDLGLKVIRRHSINYPIGGPNTLFYIHAGVDKRSSVIFSRNNGDINKAVYLWSIKKVKTSALVVGRYVETIVHGPETGLDRRVMLVDASDLDGSLETIPTGVDLENIRAAMEIRGNLEIKAQKRISLARVDISNSPTFEYRKDYDIGDIVSVDTNYGQPIPMRVVEYTESQDEDGYFAQPTLEFIG